MTNYTVKLILWEHNANEDGLFPIYIKITVERKTSYISTAHFVTRKAWDAKNETIRESHPLAKDINPELAHRKQQIIRKIVELQVAGKEITAKGIKLLFAGKDLHNIFNFIDQFCEEVKHKRDAATIEIYRRHERKLLAFNNSRNLNFEEINEEYLYKFENYLREQGDDDKTDLQKQQKGNYVSAIFKTLRVFFNAAIKRKLISCYPFKSYENPVFKSPGKNYLTISELGKWEELVEATSDNSFKQAGIYFLFGCYSGLRLSDWHRFDPHKNVVNNHIRMTAQKNEGQILIPISKPLARVIERMKGIPLTIKEPVVNRVLKRMAAKIGIQRSISTHSGRKTFAVTLCADRGISSETCAKLLSITVKVCVDSYYVVTPAKVEAETSKAWGELD